MRKIIAIFVGLLMLFSIPALGEEFNLSSMTIDELIELRNTIDNEIGSRIGFPDRQIGTGQYIVGEDIAAGKYEFVCTLVNVQESASGGKGHNLGRIALWSELSKKGEELMDVGQFVVDQIFMMDLQEGNVLLIRDANFLIKTYSSN